MLSKAYESISCADAIYVKLMEEGKKNLYVGEY